MSTESLTYTQRMFAIFGQQVWKTNYGGGFDSHWLPLVEALGQLMTDTDLGSLAPLIHSTQLSIP